MYFYAFDKKITYNIIFEYMYFWTKSSFFIRRLNTIMLKNPHGALFAVPAHFWVSSHKGKGKKCACEKKIVEGGGIALNELIKRQLDFFYLLINFVLYDFFVIFSLCLPRMLAAGVWWLLESAQKINYCHSAAITSKMIFAKRFLPRILINEQNGNYLHSFFAVNRLDLSKKGW